MSQAFQAAPQRVLQQQQQQQQQQQRQRPPYNRAPDTGSPASAASASTSSNFGLSPRTPQDDEHYHQHSIPSSYPHPDPHHSSSSKPSFDTSETYYPSHSLPSDDQELHLDLSSHDNRKQAAPLRDHLHPLPHHHHQHQQERQVSWQPYLVEAVPSSSASATSSAASRKPVPSAGFVAAPATAAAAKSFEDGALRQVSRAACLSCRSAKRKCDGAKPVCGPCTVRGVVEGLPVEEGGCVFVASKRGGPRFKGVKGAEATKRKADERERNAARGKAAKNQESVRRSAVSSFSSSSSSNLRNPRLHRAQASASTASVTSASDRSTGGLNSDSGRLSPPTPITPMSLRSDHDRRMSHSPVFGSSSSKRSRNPASHGGHSSFDFSAERDALQQPYFDLPETRGGLFDDLSVENLELWQKLQESSVTSGALSLSSFYAKVEDFPKSATFGNHSLVSGSEDVDMVFDDSSSMKSAAVNSEQSTRGLLADFYENVYPACPILLPPGNLSSLAFHFSESDSSALLAAISACVALHLPPGEVHRIIRGNAHPVDSDTPQSDQAASHPEMASKTEIAAMHASAAEQLIQQKVEILASSPPHANHTNQTPFGAKNHPSPTDYDLIRIKLVATHVLLAHYFFGKKNNRRGNWHASQGWQHAQSLKLEEHEMHPNSSPTGSSPSWFSVTQKCEWARRVFWASYAAATIIACIGGFPPPSVRRDELSDLRLLPSQAPGECGWTSLGRGAQTVSKCYVLLYQLDNLKTRGADRLDVSSQEERARLNQCYEEMLKLDDDMMDFMYHNSVWNAPLEFPDDSRSTGTPPDSIERRMVYSLRVSSRLMYSGSLVVLHRAQAFGNARVFMAPTCGVPGAMGDDDDADGEGPTPNDPSPVGTGEKQPSEPPLSGSKHSNRRRLWHRTTESPPPPAHEPRESFKDGEWPSNPDSQSSEAQSMEMSSDISSDSESVASGSVSSGQSWDPLQYEGGPFSPSLSLERCRLAANITHNALPHINALSKRSTSSFDNPRNGEEAQDWAPPSLPPFSTCPLMLSAYVLLMETLHAQIVSVPSQQGEGADQQQDDLRILHRPGDGGDSIIDNSGKTPAERLLAAIQEVEQTLAKFSRAWYAAKVYGDEVRLLLEVNASMFKP
ncbi:hypothetical protein IE53DRAFT_266967 [Violaceomyces palustris]|uniref:Uncharacterized protein n=1 Tax=Violaceomyces palustris TaxID=1673888 RepID=A0ACD0NMX5_9BASI|nr:hypothetical protein IE53DRAFT_266967 [Violaceomyces palustris]